MDDESLHTTSMVESSENFEAAYESYAHAIYTFLLYRTHNVEASEDLTSKTFEKAWIGRKNFRGGSIQAWLYRIARNVLIDHWRGHREVAIENIEELQEADEDTTAERLDREAQCIQLNEALTMLPSNMREIVKMRFIEKMSCREVAERLSMTEGNVRVMQYRALKKLRNYLQ